MKDKFLDWFWKVRWGKQIPDQAAHLLIPIAITYVVYNYPWTAVIPALFIMYEREYYQKALINILGFFENLTHIKWFAIDLVFLHISGIICILYVLSKEMSWINF